MRFAALQQHVPEHHPFAGHEGMKQALTVTQNCRAAAGALLCYACGDASCMLAVGARELLRAAAVAVMSGGRRDASRELCAVLTVLLAEPQNCLQGACCLNSLQTREPLTRVICIQKLNRQNKTAHTLSAGT